MTFLQETQYCFSGGGFRRRQKNRQWSV